MRTVRIISNISVIVLVALAWLIMFVFSPKTALSVSGAESLKFFTVQSNLFAAVSAVLSLINVLRNKKSRVVSALKLASSVSVTITFLTVLVYLGPLYGYGSMYSGGNLLFHLIVPVICILDFIFLNDYMLKYKSSLFTVLCIGIYSVGYIAVILINGKGSGHNGNDFYGFLNWGLGIGIIMYAVILAVAVLTGILFIIINNKVIKKRSAPSGPQTKEDYNG